MAESNKILDVTYGTFSCRLEGFDDTVETMKSVVGYFHDLAGHALFTENAPVVPDLETLARLTEQQSGGAVAIEEDANGVTLRVLAEEDATAATNEVEDAPVATADPETSIEETEAEDVVAKTAMPEDDSTEEDLVDEEELTFAEVPADEDPVEDAPEVEAASDDADEATTDTLDAEADEPTSGFVAAVADDVDDIAEEKALDSAPVEVSAADRLQRIRAVVGRGGPQARDDTYAEDLSEDDLKEAPKAVNPLAQRLAELAKRNSELMDAGSRSEPPTISGGTPLSLTEEELVADDFDDVADAISDDATAAKDMAQNDDFAADDASSDVAEEAADDNAETKDDDIQEPVQRRPERVEQPLLLTTRHQSITADDDDDDFDLHEEVAKIEREIAARPGNELARHGLPRTVEDAMSRILMKTDLQLDLQETRDGRDAIAQLKAAVAATEAARQLGDSGAKSRDVSAMFRDDLGALEGTERSDGTALPPLKLVEPINEAPQSTLREVAPLTEAAARLRAIAETTKANTSETTAQTFADFARQLGAKDLVDKLEAAGAYLAFVEGEDDFSRPQVMKVVQSASEEEVTREDGLRSFGRLVRQSRIIKLNNGRFQIAENTRFKPSGNQAARY